MGLFGVDFRTLFGHALLPSKRFSQTLDLGESLLTTLSDDSSTLDSTNDTLQVEKKYSGITMVMRASLNEKFGSTDFEVITTNNIVRERFLFTEEEDIPAFIYGEDENSVYYLFEETEIPADVSITVRVPSALYNNSFDQVDAEVRKLKVAGKSYKLEEI